MQNFGKIKNTFNDILVESIIDKDVEKRKIVKRFIRTISESKILKSQFLVYNNIETRVDENQFSTNMFITENINLLKGYSKKDILAENNRLVGLSQMVKSRLEDDSDYDNKDLHESITSLIFTDSTPLTIQEVTNHRLSIIKYVNENKPKVVSEGSDIPTSLLANLAASKFNEKYSHLTEDEHKVLKVILESDDGGREDVFNETRTSCLTSVNKALKESTNKAKLLDVKEKLLNTTYTSESFSEDIVKLLELKRVLTKD